VRKKGEDGGLDIKHCGNCNPDAHPTDVRRAAEALFGDRDADGLLLVNGCARVCLSKSRSKERHEGRIIDRCGRDILREEREAGRCAIDSPRRRE
jgi:hypothetical protein